MLSELREVGKLLAKEREHPAEFKNIIVINLIGFDENKHKEKKVEVKPEEINKNNIEKIPMHYVDELSSDKDPLSYPAGPYTSKAVRDRIIKWFEGYSKNEYSDNNIRKHIEEVYKFLNDRQKEIEEEVNDLFKSIVKKDNKGRFYIGIKIDGKFAGEVNWIKKAVSEVEEKEKKEGKKRGICRFCGKEGNIILDYKILSRQLLFCTLDNKSFASYFDNRDGSPNLNVCEDCFNLINKGFNYLYYKKLPIDSLRENGKKRDISFIVVPGIDEYSKFKEFKNSLSKNSSSRDKRDDQYKDKYFLDASSPDTIFRHNTYIFFQDNQQNRKIIEEIFDVDEKKIEYFIDRDEKISPYFSFGGNVSYTNDGGIIKFILNTLYPEGNNGFQNYGNEVDYKKREVIMLAIKMIKYALTENTQSIAFKDIIKKFYQLAEETLKVSLLNESISTNSSKKRRSKENVKNTSDEKNSEETKDEYNGKSYAQILAKKVLYTLFLFNIISMNETVSQNEKIGEIMKLIEMLPEEKRMWVLIGLYVGGLANFQDEKVGIRSSFIEKTLFIPNKESILNLFGEAKAKLIQYRDYEAFTEYSGRFDKIENQIAQYVLKYKYSNVNTSNEEARLLFRIGLCLKSYWFVKG
ncbi:MAG: TM1802 family CRISPR-associated protein [Nitrososphaeria archaeon]